MTTNAFTAGVTVKFGDNASPVVYTAIEEVSTIDGLGVTNELIEVTHFDSAGIKEYIAGLADGDEVSFECNKVNAAASIQGTVIAAVDAKVTHDLEVTLTDGTTVETYTFAWVPLSWKVAPNVSDKNGIAFTGKISGTITRVSV